MFERSFFRPWAAGSEVERDLKEPRYFSINPPDSPEAEWVTTGGPSCAVPGGDEGVENPWGDNVSRHFEMVVGQDSRWIPRNDNRRGCEDRITNVQTSHEQCHLSPRAYETLINPTIIEAGPIPLQDGGHPSG